jgi:hypothetical protein
MRFHSVSPHPGDIFMKRTILLAAALAAICVQPSWADGRESQNSADALALSTLAVAITPAIIGTAGYFAAREGGKSIIRLVDKTGQEIGELTEDAFNEAANISEATAPRAQYGTKEIPLVVRKEYVEMNEKVTP